jgi:uracil-DNA glycosylase
MFVLENDWKDILDDVFKSNEVQNLKEFLEIEYDNHVIYPSKENIFTALKLTSYKDVKVVIIGQDPYHEPNQAHGLAFSVLDGIKLPPSLKNIFKEIEEDLGVKMAGTGNLTSWAEQGVLLLNNVLTVREHEANSHKKRGWEYVTDKIVEKLNEREEMIIFVFWGNNAKDKQKLITNTNHIVLTAPHPSPLSAYHGFFGCKHFSQINEILRINEKKEINWKI